MGGTEKPDDFSAGQKGWTVAVGCVIIYRTVIVEGWVEGHSSAYASPFHMSLGGYFRADGVPCKQGGGPVGLSVYPPFVDGMGNGVAVDGRCRCLKIGVVAVE